MTTRRWCRSSVALLAAGALIAASCGDDDDDAVTSEASAAPANTDAPAATDAPSATEAPDEPADSGSEDSEPATTDAPTTAPAATEAPAEPTGDPVKVMVLGSFTGPYDTSFAFDTAGAAAQAVNAAGGIQGHPMEILTCDDQFDINRTLECVREADGEGAVALVAGLALNGDYVALAEELGLPIVPGVGFQPAEFQSDNSFPIGTGGAGYGTAAIAEVLAAGVTNLSLVYDESSGIAKPSAEAAAAALEAQGITVSNIVPMPLDIADASPILAAAEANGAEGAGLLLQGVQVAKLLQAREQAGSDLIVGSYDLSLEPATIEALGSAANGVLMASPFRQLSATDDPAVAGFLGELAAFDDSISTDDWSIPGVGIGVWVATHLVAQAAQQADTLDRAGVLAALPQQTNFDVGMMAPTDFSTPNTAAIPGFTRVFNTHFLFNEIQDGVVTPLGSDFVDVFAQP